MSEPVALSDADRIRLFVSTAEAYAEMAAAFPVDQSTFVVGSRQPRDPKDRWRRMVRAFALRKFTLATNDNVYVDSVMDSVEQLAGSIPVVTGALQDLRINKTAIVNGGVMFDHPDNGGRTADKIIKDALYGVFLHADLAKWKRSTAAPALFEEMALWTWTLGSERFVTALADLIRSWINDGTLVLPP